MSDFEKKLARDLSQGKEYREAYAEAFANEFLATQIQLLRKQRGWTQSELGLRIGSNQPRISVYEDQDYGNWSLDTLRRLASEFGLWLKVCFEPYSRLVDDVAHFSPASLVHPAFEDDHNLHRWLEDSSAESGRAGARRAIQRWAAAREPDLPLLANWLQGLVLPGFNSRDWMPAQYLLDTVPESEAETWDRLTEGLARLLESEEEEFSPLLNNPLVYRENLLTLARSIGPRLRIRTALQTVYDRALRRYEQTGSSRLGYEGEIGLLDAMVHNQIDGLWRDVWYGYLEGRDHPEDFSLPGHPFLPGGTVTGIRGLLGLPKNEDYWLEIARGIGALEYRFLRYGKGRVDSEPNVMDAVENAVAVVYDWWASPSAAQELMRASVELMARGERGWFMHAGAAWAYGVHQRAGWQDAVRNGANTDQERRMFADNLASGYAWFCDWCQARDSSAKGHASKPIDIGLCQALKKAEAANSRLVILKAA